MTMSHGVYVDSVESELKRGMTRDSSAPKALLRRDGPDVPPPEIEPFVSRPDHQCVSVLCVGVTIKSQREFFGFLDI